MRAGILASIGVAAVCAAACGPRRQAEPPEVHREAPIVLISVDTLRADRLGAYGAAEPGTPHVDALRKQSILFADATTPCPLTLPAHVSVLSGLLPPEHGVRDNIGYRIDPARPSLPRSLKQGGYATGAAVSAHVLRSGSGMGEGFDFYEDRVGGPEPREALREAERPGRATAQIALKWIEKHRQRPFFFLLHLYEPHSPYEPPEPFASRHRSPYDGEVAAADAVIGEFLAGLERLGLYDRALVVFLSDHGEGLGQHGEEEHGVLLYRETLRVPLLVKLPGSKSAGETVEAPVALTDVFPTIARLVGVPTPPGLAGRALFDGEPPDGPSGHYSETYYPRLHLGWSPLRSLWDGRYQLIDGPRPELYDLRQDPREAKNLFSPSFEPARTLKRQLEARPESFSAPAPADPEDLRKLASLGYLTFSDELSREGGLPNPVDHVQELAEAGKAFRLAADGDRARAIAMLEKILRKNPTFFDARYKLAELLTKEGRLPEAEKAYQEAIALSPGLANLIALDLARIHLALKKLSEAEAEARLAAAVSPGESREVLARVAMARGDPAQALRELALAVRAAGSDTSPSAGLHFLRGEALARLGRRAEAAAAFREEIRRSPAHSEAYARLAILYALEGRRVSEVRSLLDSMHAQDPRRETALLAAQTLESLGDREGAAAWKRRADIR